MKLKNWIDIPTPGIEPGPRRWEHRILTTRLCGRWMADRIRNFIWGVKNFSFFGCIQSLRNNWKLKPLCCPTICRSFEDHVRTFPVKWLRFEFSMWFLILLDKWKSNTLVVSWCCGSPNDVTFSLLSTFANTHFGKRMQNFCRFVSTDEFTDKFWLN